VNWLALALEAALVVVILLVLIELLRLQRALRAAQLALPDTEEARRMEQSLRAAVDEAQTAVAALMSDMERLRGRADTSGDEGVLPAQPTDSQRATEGPHRSTEREPKRSPRVFSEAGRAKYDKVLHLASQGLDVDSIAGEVDLTKAEVELMLGSVG